MISTALVKTIHSQQLQQLGFSEADVEMASEEDWALKQRYINLSRNNQFHSAAEPRQRTIKQKEIREVIVERLSLAGECHITREDTSFWRGARRINGWDVEIWVDIERCGFTFRYMISPDILLPYDGSHFQGVSRQLLSVGYLSRLGIASDSWEAWSQEDLEMAAVSAEAVFLFRQESPDVAGQSGSRINMSRYH